MVFLFIFLDPTHQPRGSSESVRLATACLSVAEHGGVEPLHSHLHESLDAGELEHILLAGSGFEDHVVGEELGFVLLRGISWHAAQPVQLELKVKMITIE